MEHQRSIDAIVNSHW